MRIAHFCDSHAGRPDGVTRSAELTVRLLRAAGHEVDFRHPGPLLRPGDRVRSLPIPFRHVRVGLPFRPGPADLVHVHTTGPIGMTGFRLAARARIPLVLTWHTDLLAYADLFPEIPVGAAWCAVRLGLGWSPREFLELTRPGAVRHRRLVALGNAMFSRAMVAIAPSAKTAAGLAVFHPSAEIHVLPTPISPTDPVGQPGPTGYVGQPGPIEPTIPASQLEPTGPGGPSGPGRPGEPGGPSGPREPGRPGGPSGPDEPHAPLTAVGRLGLGRDVVLSVGRATAEKNPELLLRAFALVRAVKPEARLILLGARQQRGRLRHLIGRLGLTGHVDVLPPVPHAQVAAYYRAADVLAFASTTDTQSLVLAEAEAAGLPVVVADPALGTRPGESWASAGRPADGSWTDGGAAHTPAVDGGWTGGGAAGRPALGGPVGGRRVGRYTCAPTPDAFAGALLRMLDDGGLRATVSRGGLAAAAAYPPEVFVGRLLEIYERARRNLNQT